MKTLELNTVREIVVQAREKMESEWLDWQQRLNAEGGNHRDSYEAGYMAAIRQFNHKLNIHSKTFEP